MMKVRVAKTFVKDLITHDDRKLARRALDQVFDRRGEFRVGKDDHRFHGVENAWIRYVSRGNTAYRIIYIQEGDRVTLYRCGGHDIEDKVTAPKDRAPTAISAFDPHLSRQEHHLDYGLLLDGVDRRQLRHEIHSLLHVGHREIWIISPYITYSMISSAHPFGQFLFKANEEGTTIWLVTKPPDRPVPAFRALVDEGIEVFFLENLHSKMYLFDVEPTTVNEFQKDITHRTALIGSANLTDAGFNLEGAQGNEEICYRLPTDLFEQAREYANRLADHADDFVAHQRRNMRY